MSYRKSIVGLFLCSVMIFVACGPRQTQVKAACVVGADTMSVAQVQAMEPDTAPQKVRTVRAAVQVALSRDARLPCGDVKDTGFYSDLSNQLSLQTGAAWSPRSAACLYSAAKAVRMKFMALPNAQSVASYVDSLFLTKVKIDSGISRRMFLNDSLLATVDNKKTRQDLEKLLSSIFHISAKTAFVLADFLVSEETEKSSPSSMASSIKGLVADGRHGAQRQASREAPEIATAPAKDPSLALKYRPQQAISDSIKKHVHDLEAIYKKQLKTHPGLTGTVWVTFVILPDGSVATAQVHSADIGEKDFLAPFSHYVERIRFSKIPDAVGPMTFEFPFEFSPEN